MEASTFTELLMRKKRMEILQYLLDNRGEQYTINELAKNIDVSYTTTYNVIQKLADFGIVSLSEKGAYNIVSLNENSPYIEVLEDLGDLDAKPLRSVAQEYAEELQERVDNEISYIGLFGSVARGLPTSESDIDILILAEEEGAVSDVNKEAQSLADKYSRERDVLVSPLVMAVDQFRRERESDAPLEVRISEEGESLVGDLPDG